MTEHIAQSKAKDPITPGPTCHKSGSTTNQHVEAFLAGGPQTWQEQIQKLLRAQQAQQAQMQEQFALQIQQQQAQMQQQIQLLSQNTPTQLLQLLHAAQTQQQGQGTSSEEAGEIAPTQEAPRRQEGPHQHRRQR